MTRVRSYHLPRALLLLASPVIGPISGRAQAPATQAAPAAARQVGTVRAVTAGSLTLTNDKGEQVTVSISPEARVVQLAPGSTDLKTAQPAAVSDIAVGDRVLAVGVMAETTPPSFTARRLVLMKSTDIAKQRETEQAGWQHGTGGLVTAVDAAAGTVTLSAGRRTITVATSPATVVRRYKPGSARYEDATRSTLAEVHTGDQMRVRGERSADGGSVKADEIISGSFRHLSGTITAMDPAAAQLTVADSTTKKPETLTIAPEAALHQLPPEIAARFAARSKGAAGPHAAAPAAAANASAEAGPGPGGAGGGDLSQVVAHLPPVTLADFKVGDAVMVVGTEGAAGSVAALTVLGGVGPILAASPKGGAEMALAPWSVGGGDAGGGGSAP